MAGPAGRRVAPTHPAPPAPQVPSPARTRDSARAGRGVLPLLLAGAALAVALALVMAGRSVLLRVQALDEQTFLAAADAMRTALTTYYLAGERSGHPALPTSLAQLGADGVPIDPWTGAADWGLVRNAQGAITGFYSRSGRTVVDPSRLARLAVPRPGLDATARAAMGVSAWQFAWTPPGPLAPSSAPAERGLARPLSPPDWQARATHASPPAPAVTPTRASAPLVLQGRAAVPVSAPPADKQPPSRTLFVPIQSASEATGSRVAAPAQDGIMPATAPPDALPVAGEAPVSAAVEQAPEFQYSEDPRLNRCQRSMGADHPERVCRLARENQDTDAGIAYDDCVRELEMRVKACSLRP